MVPIDPAGRIVIPKDIREELAIKPGDTFKLSIQGSSVTLTPTRESNGFIRKGKALVFSTTGGETITEEHVAEALQAAWAERHEQSLAGLRRRNRPK